MEELLELAARARESRAHVRFELRHALYAWSWRLAVDRTLQHALLSWRFRTEELALISRAERWRQEAGKLATVRRTLRKLRAWEAPVTTGPGVLWSWTYRWRESVLRHKAAEASCMLGRRTALTRAHRLWASRSVMAVRSRHFEMAVAQFHSATKRQRRALGEWVRLRLRRAGLEEGRARWGRRAALMGMVALRSNVARAPDRLLRSWLFRWWTNAWKHRADKEARRRARVGPAGARCLWPWLLQWRTLGQERKTSTARWRLARSVGVRHALSRGLEAWALAARSASGQIPGEVAVRQGIVFELVRAPSPRRAAYAAAQDALLP